VVATIHLGSVDDGSSQPKRDKRVTTRSHGLTEYLRRYRRKPLSEDELRQTDAHLTQLLSLQSFPAAHPGHSEQPLRGKRGWPDSTDRWNRSMDLMRGNELAR